MQNVLPISKWLVLAALAVAGIAIALVLFGPV